MLKTLGNFLVHSARKNDTEAAPTGAGGSKDVADVHQNEKMENFIQNQV